MVASSSASLLLKNSPQSGVRGAPPVCPRAQPRGRRRSGPGAEPFLEPNHNAGSPSMLDRITVSVVQHRFVAIVAEMGEAMLRTAYSQILNSSRDFSTALCDGQGRLVAQAEHVPIHVGGLPCAVRAVLEDFKGGIRPGDLFLLNDPYHGGNHL